MPQEGAKITKKNNYRSSRQDAKTQREEILGFKEGQFRNPKKVQARIKENPHTETQRHKEKQTTYPHAPTKQHVGQEGAKVTNF